MKTRAKALRMFIGLCVCVSTAAISAQTYPTKPVRVISGSPGAIGDVIIRQLAQRLGERWAQPVVVDNRATAILAAAAAAKATPDGYTLVLGDRTSHAVAPQLQAGLAYDPVTQFAPITLVARAPMVFVAHPSVPASNLAEFIAYARQRPGAINYAAAGPGTAVHIAAERFKQLAGIDLVNVQYKGGGAAMMALVSGESQVGFVLTPVAVAHVKSGKVKAYVITSATRFAGAPDVPTTSEAGVPGLEGEQLWLALFAPARTARDLIAKLNSDVVDVLKTSATRDALRVLGAEAAPCTPEALAQLLATETVLLKKVIQTAGIRAD